MNYKPGNIYFEKPDYKKLERERWNFYDMHNHTTVSDGFTQVKDIIAKAKRNGYGIAIADHNEIKASLIACRKYKKCIPAIEVTAAERKDYLFYFYDAEELQRFHKDVVQGHTGKKLIPITTTVPTETLIAAQKDYDCIMSVAHPGGILKNNIEWLEKHRVFQRAAALEAFNGTFGKKRNLRSLMLAKRFKKAMTAGSDSHRINQSGSVLCVSDSRDEFLDAVRKRKNFVLGEPIHWSQQTVRLGVFMKHFRKAWTQAYRILAKQV